MLGHGWPSAARHCGSSSAAVYLTPTNQFSHKCRSCINLVLACSKGGSDSAQHGPRSYHVPGVRLKWGGPQLGWRPREHHKSEVKGRSGRDPMPREWRPRASPRGVRGRQRPGDPMSRSQGQPRTSRLQCGTSRGLHPHLRPGAATWVAHVPKGAVAAGFVGPRAFSTFKVRRGRRGDTPRPR